MSGRLIINENSGFSSPFKGAVVYQTPDDLIRAIENKISPDLTLTTPSENIRYRHVVKGSDHYYMVFNEGETDVSTKLLIPVTGKCQLLNPSTAEAVILNADENINFKPHELKVVRVNN